MKKAEIWKVRLTDALGSEQSGFRPALIVSGDLLNVYGPVIWICPLTTKIKNYKGGIVLEPTKKNGIKKRSEVLCMHLRSISKNSLIEKIGCIEPAQLKELRSGISDTLFID